VIPKNQVLILIRTIIVALLMAGCSNQKAVECEKLITGINQGHTLVSNFKGKDAPAASKLANELDTVIKQLENLELKDKQLKHFQQQFSEIYKNLSAAFRNTAQALRKASAAGSSLGAIEQLQNAKKQVEAAGKVAEESAQKADQLGKEINKYCTGKSKS
jgi:DNA repair ATPase RecN